MFGLKTQGLQTLEIEELYMINSISTKTIKNSKKVLNYSEGSAKLFMFRKERERKHKREKKNLCCERLFR
jgi:hypothetical protein